MALRSDRSKQSGTDDPDVVNRYTGTGVTVVLFALFLLVVALIIVLAQNTDPVPFRFLGFEAEPPLFVVLLVTAAGAAAATELLGGIWRRRRRRQRTEREELRRLRSERENR